MKLILEKDVKNVGKAGDTVSVKPGYARNYLLPRKLAVTSTVGHLKELRHKTRIIEIRKKKAIEEREKTIARLQNIRLVFEKEARSNGQLFGSLLPTEISNALSKKHSLSVDKRDIFSSDVKTTGEHKVKVALDSKRETVLSVTVKQKKAAKKREDLKAPTPPHTASAPVSESESLKETKTPSSDTQVRPVKASKEAEPSDKTKSEDS